MYAWVMSLGGWLQEQLFERRIVLVTGRLDDDAAAKAAAALLTLDARADRPIELHLNSPDGAPFLPPPQTMTTYWRPLY